MIKKRDIPFIITLYIVTFIITILWINNLIILTALAIFIAMIILTILK